MHEEWTDKLSDYLDGELTDDERREVDGHLHGCSECTAVLNDLKRVVARARAAADAARPPAADLWGGIAARLEPSRSKVTPLTPRAARRVSFTLPQLAAAAALVAAASGGIVWSALIRPAANAATAVARSTTSVASDARDDTAPAAASDARQPSIDPQVAPVSMADAQYDAAVADLEGALKQGRGRLDASTISIVERNLQIIDEAIDQAREALAADPANTYLSGHLVEARRRKLELLRRAAALTSESN